MRQTGEKALDDLTQSTHCGVFLSELHSCVCLVCEAKARKLSTCMLGSEKQEMLQWLAQPSGLSLTCLASRMIDPMYSAIRSRPTTTEQNEDLAGAALEWIYSNKHVSA